MAVTPTILLVDDDETARYLGQRLLQRLGVQATVHEATNGEEALRLLQTNNLVVPSPWLVLLDINMPVMSGFELLEAYQALPLAGRRNTHMVLVTSSQCEQDLRRAAMLGTEVLGKPLTLASLTPLLERLGYLALA